MKNILIGPFGLTVIAITAVAIANVIHDTVVEVAKVKNK